jgi:hypothetical protein
MPALTVANLQKALAKVQGANIQPTKLVLGPAIVDLLASNPGVYRYLRKKHPSLTIESVKPVKVSGYIDPELHSRLLMLANLVGSTAGALVATAVRRLVEKPRALGGLRIDGRSAKAKALKRKRA